MLQYVRGFAKQSLSYLPFVGTALKGMGFVFVSRNFDEDKKRISSAFSTMRQGKFWLFTHLEGSRFCEAKKLEGHQFATERGLPHLQHVLLPRVKGMVESILPTLG